MSPQQTVDFIYFEAGGGHRSAALALQAVIASQAREWNVRLVNLQEVLDELDIFRKLTGVRMEDIYNRMLAKGWTRGSGLLLPPMHGVIRVYHRAQVKLLTKYWGVTRPDMVVSLVPNFNRALFQSLERALPGRPFVTVLTDLADFPPHFWMEKQPDQFFICGTPRAVQQAVAIGHPRERVFQTSGMILRPAFYEAADVDRRRERERLGLDPDVPTGLVLFGGEGSNVMHTIACGLGNSSLRVQLLLIAGRNDKLKTRLERLQTRNKLHVEGFTKQVPLLMRISDFFIGKPGPGSLAEAQHMGLPVIVERNACTLPQERYNTQWIQETGTGVVLKSFSDVVGAVEQLLQPATFAAAKARIAAQQNRAVFEVPDLLERILLQNSSQHPSQHPSQHSGQNHSVKTTADAV